MRAFMVVNHHFGIRAGQRDFYTKLAFNADAVYTILNDLSSIAEHRETLEKLYKGLLACFIEDYPTFKEIYTINGSRGSPAMHLFVELSRTHFLLTYDQLVAEKIQLLELNDLDAEPPDNDMLLMYSPAKCKSEFWVNLEEVDPIMTYGQEKIISLPATTTGDSCCYWPMTRVGTVMYFLPGDLIKAWSFPALRSLRFRQN